MTSHHDYFALRNFMSSPFDYRTPVASARRAESPRIALRRVLSQDTSSPHGGKTVLRCPETCGTPSCRMSRSSSERPPTGVRPRRVSAHRAASSSRWRRPVGSAALAVNSRSGRAGGEWLWRTARQAREW